jgi:hypothetical protein
MKDHEFIIIPKEKSYYKGQIKEERMYMVGFNTETGK